MSNGSQYNVNAPTQTEIDHWNNEFAQFDFPSWCYPPVDAWDYMLAEYKKMRKLHQQSTIQPNEKYSLRVVSFSFFAWLFSEDGTQWLLNLFGIEEVKPHAGYRYWFGGKPHTSEGTLIGKETESSIRVYTKNSINRFAEPPSEQDGAIDEMKTILVKVYKHKRAKAPKFPTPGMWNWLLGALRNFFTEPADKHWPYSKPDRIHGIQWAQQVKDPECPSSTMWDAVTETEKFHPRAYRIEQRGGVIWCGRTHIYTEPMDAFMYREGIKAIKRGDVNFDEDELGNLIKNDFRCESCDAIIPCVSKAQGPQGSVERLCENCFGSQENGSHSALDNCTYTECYQCPNFIRTPDDLKNLKQTLGQSYDFPVRR